MNAHMGYIDILPTIRVIAGASSPPKQPLDGRNMLAVLQGADEEVPRDWFAFLRDPLAERLSMHSVGWKLMWVKNRRRRPPVETMQLFAIRDDPSETENVADAYPAIVDELLDELIAFRALQSDDPIKTPPFAPPGWQPPPEEWRIPLPEPARSSDPSG